MRKKLITQAAHTNITNWFEVIMQPFTAEDYAELYELAFNVKNPGYKPFTFESPNGDGKFDFDKRYAHIAMKYLNDPSCTLDETEVNMAEDYLSECMDLAITVAITLGIPREFWPDERYSTLRVLEYKPGAISHEHTDFDLFTLMMYRNIPECFNYSHEVTRAASPGVYTVHHHMLGMVSELNPQIHFGELLREINNYYYPTPHYVDADTANRTQYSVVFFAIPDHDAILPDGTSVEDWLQERKGRSRKDSY
jgi:hypothetical protein